MEKYFILDCCSSYDAEYIRLQAPKESDQYRWKEGLLIPRNDEQNSFPDQIELIEMKTELESEPESRIFAELYWDPIPLMSRRLVSVLRSAGIDNIQIFSTRLSASNRKNIVPADYYSAVNIVGLLTDENRANGMLMFRHAENVSAVFVHQKVRAVVESQGIANLLWFSPEEWPG